MAQLIVAARPELTMAGEHSFIESAVPDESAVSYSTILDEQDCTEIDRIAYVRSRSWFLDGSGEDPTSIGEVSLGRAFELRATAILVRFLRARLVLLRLAAAAGSNRVSLRGMSAEWWSAARDLGLKPDGDEPSMVTTGGIPNLGSVGPSAGLRVLGRLSSRPWPAGTGRVSLVGSPRWADTYRATLASFGRSTLVNPTRRVLAGTALSAAGADITWIADGPAVPAEPPTILSREPDSAERLLLTSLQAEWANLTTAAAIGSRLACAALVATEDVSPSIRAVVLGAREQGARILTLEHGLSGGYAQQVHSVGHALGVWGPGQARYHRASGPEGLEIVELGWPRLANAVHRRRVTAATTDVQFFGQPAVPLSAGSWPEDSLRPHAVLEALATSNPSYRVAVKLHPAMAAYMNANPVHRHARVITGDSITLIRAARVVVATRSTTALEAMALGVPVILIEQRGSVGPWDLLATPAVRRARDLRELSDALDQLLRDQSVWEVSSREGQEFARDSIRGLDKPGSAEERFGRVVSGLLARTPTRAAEGNQDD